MIYVPARLLFNNHSRKRRNKKGLAIKKDLSFRLLSLSPYLPCQLRNIKNTEVIEE
jgi:hypothetical protein